MIAWHCTWQDQEISLPRTERNKSSSHWHWNVSWKLFYVVWNEETYVWLVNRTKRSDNAQWNRKFLEFSKWVSGNVLFHSILYWNFRKFWSNADRAQYFLVFKGDMFSVAYMTYYLKNWPYRFVFTANCNCSISVYAAFTKSLIKGFILERIFDTFAFTTSEVRYCLAIKCLCIPLKTEIPFFHI